MSINRVAALAIAASLACALPARAQPIDKAEMQAVIAKADEELNKRYIYSGSAAHATARVKAALAAGEYDTITDDKVFAQRITADLRAVTHDKHMNVYLASDEDRPASATGNATPPPKANAGFLAVDRLKGNIGYINLQNFPDPVMFKLVADQAMADLSGTRALIIDMRGNGGGSAESDAYFGSLFFDPQKPVQLNAVVYRDPETGGYERTEFWTKPVPTPYLGKPVYLLSSRRTFSAGEAFLYDLKSRGRARLIGEVTGGGANPGRNFSLNPRFRIFIPTGRAENPVTKDNWEGTGVAPDVTVPASQALRVAMLEITKDPALKLERAMAVTEFEPVHLLKFRDRPQPGAADILKRHLTLLARGEPDYTLLSERPAADVRQNLSGMKDMLAAAGEIKTVSFKYVGPAGLDVYEVNCANRTLLSGIFLMPDGKIAANWFRPETP